MPQGTHNVCQLKATLMSKAKFCFKLHILENANSLAVCTLKVALERNMQVTISISGSSGNNGLNFDRKQT